MALVNRYYPEMESHIILNEETNEYVLGGFDDSSAEFNMMDESEVVLRNNFPNEKSYKQAVESMHQKLVSELRADGFSVIFS